MSSGFKVWNVLHNEYINHNPHVAGAVITASLFIAGGVAYRYFTPQMKMSEASLALAPEEALVPSGKFSLRNVVESLSEYIRDRARDIIGEEYPQYLPMLSFVFMWLLVNNLMGIIPGLGSPTDNVNITFAMGIFVFLYYNIKGFASHGFRYIEQFMGHLNGVLLYTVGILLLPLELLSHLIRPMTLGIRLRTNIYADHTVYETISGLTHKLGEFLGVKFGAIGTFLGYAFSALAPVPIVILGIVVCVVQALVFTILSCVYISIATAHEEH